MAVMSTTAAARVLLRIMPLALVSLQLLSLLLLLSIQTASAAAFPPHTAGRLANDFPTDPGFQHPLRSFSLANASDPNVVMAHNSHFRIVTKFDTDYIPSTITKYESTRTGMTAVVVDRKGPKVLGFFALATEIFDDSGAPHTLEHLCFMGSKSYPYKGILDRLATRCVQGAVFGGGLELTVARAYAETNAWTATDHTAYTIETAGYAGFAQILPVYLEHMLFPTLTDASCITEVHHINGAGEDAGVVYSEMQGVQNTQEILMSEKAAKMLYPDGIGYRYETGGMMDALRVLTPERIREFHRDMYQPKNLCLIIVGEVDQKHLLGVLDKFEDGIIKDISDPNAPWRRPWVDSKRPPKLTESKVATVEFPEKDESMGEVMVGFLAHDCMDIVVATASDVLSMYLAGSSVSVLEKTLVETFNTSLKEWQSQEGAKSL